MWIFQSISNAPTSLHFASKNPCAHFQHSEMDRGVTWTRPGFKPLTLIRHPDVVPLQLNGRVCLPEPTPATLLLAEPSEPWLSVWRTNPNPVKFRGFHLCSAKMLTAEFYKLCHFPMICHLSYKPQPCSAGACGASHFSRIWNPFSDALEWVWRWRWAGNGFGEGGGKVV